MKFPRMDSRLIIYSSAGLEFGLSVVVGFLIGDFLDKQFNTSPWLLLLFAVFGMIAGFRSLFRMWKRIQRDFHSNSDSTS